MKLNRIPYNGMIPYNDMSGRPSEVASNGKKIIKVGLTKTKEKGDWMRSEKRERFIV